MKLFPEEEWTHLLAALQSFGSARYVPVCGNAGDALIGSGAARLFELGGLRPETSAAADISRGDCVILAGGGNLVPQYRDCAQALRHCLAVGARRVLVLPHTVRGHEDLLGELDERFTFACRDHESVRWVREYAPRANVFFSHDLALLLDASASSSKPIDVTGRWARHCLNPRYMRWQMRLLGVEVPEGKLSIFRGDSERSVIPEHQDVPSYYISQFLARGECKDVTADVFRLMRRATELHTNRLHMGIAGALGGLRVFLHDNSYGKISALHEASLSRFPNVALVSSPSAEMGRSHPPGLRVADGR